LLASTPGAAGRNGEISTFFTIATGHRIAFGRPPNCRERQPCARYSYVERRLMLRARTLLVVGTLALAGLLGGCVYYPGYGYYGGGYYNGYYGGPY
jgi:hypothetical protein